MNGGAQSREKPRKTKKYEGCNPCTIKTYCYYYPPRDVQKLVPFCPKLGR